MLGRAPSSVKHGSCEMLTTVSSGVRRGLLVVCAVVACAGLILVARRGVDAPATSDMAVIATYTRLASHGQLWLGAYSRFQWHHPGPLPFYLLAPFYALSGGITPGLHAGAAVLSLGLLSLALSVLLRRRPLLGLAASVAFAVCAWRSAEALASPWNPHMALLPMLALIVLTADVVAGRFRSLPLVACAPVWPRRRTSHWCRRRLHWASSPSCAPCWGFARVTRHVRCGCGPSA